MTPREFGEKIAADVNWSDVLSGAGRGALGGGLVGGVHGLIAPGEEDVYDDEGNVIGQKQRNRFGAAIRGALSGAALGGLGGGAMNYIAPNSVGAIYDAGRRLMFGKTQPQLNMQDNVAKMTYEQRMLHNAYLQGQARQQAARGKPPAQHAPAPREQLPPLVMDPEPWETGRLMSPEQVARSERALGDYSNVTWPHTYNLGAQPTPNSTLSDAELDALNTQ